MKISIYKETGTGYERGWYTNCKCRYRGYKGARNTKKSYVMAGEEAICKILDNPLRNILFIRNTQASNKLSTFSTIEMLLEKWQIRDDFKINYSDMIITYKPTKQVMVFKGCDNPDKITSIRVVSGFLTDVYVEEAFELKDYEQWRKIDGSIRGNLPDGLFFQITFLFNAWSKEHWLYYELFKGRLEDDLNALLEKPYIDYMNEDEIWGYGKGIYLHISTYKINEFRDTEIYDLAMEELRKKAPEIYKVEALGMWGCSTESTYPEFSDELIRSVQEINNMSYASYCIGIDTGLSNGEGKIKTGKDVRLRTATTMQMVGLTSDYGKICCIDEFFYSNEKELIKKTEPQLMEEIIDTLIKWKETYALHPVIMKGTICVYVDCADIGFRQGLELVARQKGLFNARFLPSTKIRIQTRVDFIRLIMAWGEYLISANCKNLIREIKNSHRGEKGEPREDFDDHAINSNEYAWQPIINRLKRWKTFKEH